MSEPLVIIGKGMAATRLVDELSKRALGRYAVAVIGEEPRRAYNRVLLSSLLADEVSAEDVELKPAQWWHDRGVTTLYGQAVTHIEPDQHQVVLADGRTLPYAKLVLAIGSQPVRLPLPGSDLDGVMTFRDFEDVERMREAVRPGRPAVVIGGGLLGLEAAYGLAKAGVSVTVIHLMDRLMERQLDQAAGMLLAKALQDKGIRVLTEASTHAILGKKRVEAVELADGTILPADCVVMAVGVRPNTGLAVSAGLGVNRGILVDDQLRTTLPDIYAIGECIEHRGQVYGLVEPAYEQARVLAEILAGRAGAYGGSLTATNLKVSGVNVFSAGRFIEEEGDEVLTLNDPAIGDYKKFVLRDRQLIGAVLCGDTADALWYLDLIRSRRDMSSLRADLAFGRLACEAAPLAA